MTPNIVSKYKFDHFPAFIMIYGVKTKVGGPSGARDAWLTDKGQIDRFSTIYKSKR